MKLLLLGVLLVLIAGAAFWAAVKWSGMFLLLGVILGVVVASRKLR